MQIQVVLTFDITQPSPPLAVSKTTFTEMEGSPVSDSLGITGGTPPYHVQVDPAVVPPGLTIETDGSVSGTPTTAGTFTVPVTVTDSGQ